MYTRLLFILLLGATWMCSCQTEQSPVNTLADRVTEGTSKDRILFRMIADENNPLKDYFEISSEDGKVLITGNSDLSLATGLNWYLKYVAGIHLSWNNLSQKLPEILPLPQEKIRKETSMQNRYYLNYCTYSYSMVFWDWERWEKEIDWMAMHGINMPLSITGMEVVWYNLLKRLGYTTEEVNEFISGPAFMAWVLSLYSPDMLEWFPVTSVKNSVIRLLIPVSGADSPVRLSFLRKMNTSILLPLCIMRNWRNSMEKPTITAWIHFMREVTRKE